jgi:hypothetical protein
VGPGELLGLLLRRMGIPAEDVPVSYPKRLAAYRARTAERTLLLILGNAQYAGQVEDLLPPSGTDRPGSIRSGRCA